VVPVSVAPDQRRAFGSLRRGCRAETGSGVSEALCLGLERLFKDGTMLRLGRAAGAGGPALQGLNNAVIQAADDKLTHRILRGDIVL
jgi:hypothetical protein